MTRHRRDRLGEDREAGNAILEFSTVSVLLLVPLVYVLLTVFSAQRGAFATTQAAREAGRAIATADTLDAGLARAEAAVDLALADQHVAGRHDVAVVRAGASCDSATGTAGASLAPGSRFTVCVLLKEPLPYTDSGLFHLATPALRIAASSLVVVDSYRSTP